MGRISSLKEFFHIHPSVILWLSVLYYLSPEILLPFFLASGVHEFGHAYMLCKLNRPPARIIIRFSGANMETPALTCREEFLSAMAGPGASLLLALFFPVLPVAGGYSFLLGVLNLLPLPGLDGWRMLKCGLSMAISPEHAEQITGLISLIASALVIIISVFMSQKWHFGLWPPGVVGIWLLRNVKNFRSG